MPSRGLCKSDLHRQKIPPIVGMLGHIHPSLKAIHETIGGKFNKLPSGPRSHWRMHLEWKLRRSATWN